LESVIPDRILRESGKEALTLPLISAVRIPR
jgi:hypothetical protein